MPQERETVLPVLMRPGETRMLLNAADRYFINPRAVATVIITIIVLHLHYSLFLTADTRWVSKAYCILILYSMHIHTVMVYCFDSYYMKI